MRQRDPYETPKSNLSVGEPYGGRRSNIRYYLPLTIVLGWPWLSKAINGYLYPRLSDIEIQLLSKVMVVLFAAVPIVAALLYCLFFETRAQKIGHFVVGLIVFTFILLIYAGLLIAYV